MARLIQRYILHFSLDWGPTLLIFIKGERQARQRLSRGFFHDSIERHESRHGRGAVRRDCRSLGSTGWDPKNAGAQDQQEVWRDLACDKQISSPFQATVLAPLYSAGER